MGAIFTEIDQLQYFVDVAETLSFSEAAKRNHVSQPAISNSINSLETQLGSRLFARTTHNVTLTQSGWTLLPYARDILNIFAIATSKIRHTIQYQGELMLLLPAALQVELSGYLTEFLERYPNIYLTVRSAANFFSALDDPDADICFGFISEPQFVHSKRVVKFLKKERMGLAYPKKWFEEEDFSLEELKKRPYLSINAMRNKQMADAIHHICLANDFMPTIRGFCDDLDMALANVESGWGYGILPSTLIHARLRDKIGFYELMAEGSEMYLAYAFPKDNKNHAVSFFCELLPTECQSD